MQIELAQLPVSDLVPWNKLAVQLLAREKTILATRETEWLAQLRRKGEPLHNGEATGKFNAGLSRSSGCRRHGFGFKAKSFSTVCL